MIAEVITSTFLDTARANLDALIACAPSEDHPDFADYKRREDEMAERYADALVERTVAHLRTESVAVH